MSDEDSTRGFAEFFSRPFELDLRSLAVFRVGLGLLLLCDLVNRAWWLRAHYTDWGVMPREALLDTLWDRAWMSVHLFSGTFAPTAILFVLSGAVAVALLVGFRTTIATALSWFLLISLHARNPIVLQGGDIIFRLLLFWAIFLPLGARWSIDAALDTRGGPWRTQPTGSYSKCSRLVFSLFIAIGISLSCLELSTTFDVSLPAFLLGEGGLALTSYEMSIRQIAVAAGLLLAVASSVWIYVLDDDDSEEPEVEEYGDHSFHSAATIAYVAQISFLYVFAAILKTGSEWRSEFTATYFALSLDQFTTFIGDWLYRLGESIPILEVLTISSFGVEAVGWVLLFSVFALPVLLLDPIHRLVLALVVVPDSFYAEQSWWVIGALVVYLVLPVFVVKWAREILDFAYRSAPHFRLVAIVSFIGMHIGFTVAMQLGLFSYIVTVAWLALLPSWFWDRVAERVETFGEECTIRTASAGGLEEKGARLAREFFMLPAAEIEAGELEDSGRKGARFAVEIDGDESTGFRGLSALAKCSMLGKPLLWIAGRLAFVRRLVRRTITGIAARPTLRGALDRALPLRPVRVAQTSIGAVLSVVALSGAFWWNVQTLNSDYSMVQPWRTVAVYFRLDQKWNMFAPYPLKEDGWYVIPGELRNGEKVSLFQHPQREPADWEKPDDVSATYPNQRWRKYMMNIWLSKYSEQRLYYGRYLCRKWNSEHPRDEHLMTFKIFFMKEVSKPDYEIPEPEKTHLWSHNCFASPDDEEDGDDGDEEENDSEEESESSDVDSESDDAE